MNDTSSCVILKTKAANSCPEWKFSLKKWWKGFSGGMGYEESIIKNEVIKPWSNETIKTLINNYRIMI